MGAGPEQQRVLPASRVVPGPAVGGQRSPSHRGGLHPRAAHLPPSVEGELCWGCFPFAGSDNFRVDLSDLYTYVFASAANFSKQLAHVAMRFSGGKVGGCGGGGSCCGRGVEGG